MSISQQEIKHSMVCTCLGLIVFLSLLTTSVTATEPPPAIPPEVQERLDRATAPPPTHYNIMIGEHTFRVPDEYIAQMPPNREFFEMLAFWPGLMTIKEDERETFDGIFSISVRPGNIEELERVAFSHQQRIKAFGRSLVSDAVVQGLTTEIDRFGEPSQFHFDEDIEALLSQDILMILCGPPGGLYKVGACSTRFSPIPGVVVTMRFDKSALPQWRDMIAQTTQLLMDFKED
jgi:hypothetical protein